MANHTPGPWIAREMFSGHWQVMQDDTARPIAGVYGDHGDYINARLIAAAPDLLESLDSIEDAASVGRSTFGTLPDSAEDRCIYYVKRLVEIAAKCRAATNKARGI